MTADTRHGSADDVSKPKHLWLRVLLPFGVGYFLSYLFRTVNAVIAPDLTRDAGLSAGDLGFLTSTYFFSFALFQLPLGILLDRYGPRRVEAALLLVAAGGAAVFAVSHTLAGLALGRALIGLGVSACLMGGYTACAIWFAPPRIPAVNSVVLSAGGLGALTATAPVEIALRFTDWHGLFIWLSVAALLVAGLIYWAVPEKPRRVASPSLRVQTKEAFSVLKSAGFWRVAPVATLAQSAFLALQGLWAGPWLRDVAGLSRDAAADYLFWIAAAMFAGQLGWGNLASRLVVRGVAALTLVQLGLGVFLAVQAALVLAPTAGSLPLWMGFTFFGAAGSLTYPIIAQEFPRELAGRANSAVNLLVFVFAFLWQWLVGVVINRWPAAGGGYQPAGYSMAFSVVLAAEILAFVWLMVWRSRSSPP